LTNNNTNNLRLLQLQSNRYNCKYRTSKLSSRTDNRQTDRSKAKIKIMLSKI